MGRMLVENKLPIDAPKANFAKGFSGFNEAIFLGLGNPEHGKVRDSWIVEGRRVLVTTDRQSAFDRVVGAIPGKGAALNLTSKFWFQRTENIVPNHMITVPHPNVLIAQQAAETLPVEVVVRRFMAKSSTDTSVYHNYAEKGRRTIYGIDFPEGLKPNQEFPMGTIITPTTKAGSGHDQELTDDQANELVGRKLGKGTWKQVKQAALALFNHAFAYCLSKGLILADTKYEFGLDNNTELMLIDEVHTPDSSRFWLAATYEQRMTEGKNPESFDKEILRRWLAEHNFKGEGPVPTINPEIIDQMAQAYTVPYRMVTGKNLPSTLSPQEFGIFDRIALRNSIMPYFPSIFSQDP